MMLKLNSLLCYGTITSSSECITPWIYEQMIVQGLDVILWVTQLVKQKIQFNWKTFRKFSVMILNLHVIHMFKLCVVYAVANKRLL